MSTTRVRLGVAALLAVFVGLAGPTSGLSEEPQQCGAASWYALRSRTASGEMMNPAAMTAAHRTLPFGTRIRVTNHGNGRSVVVTINDRGPFINRRVLDLSRAAADRLGFRHAGTAEICFERV